MTVSSSSSSVRASRSGTVARSTLTRWGSRHSRSPSSPARTTESAGAHSRLRRSWAPRAPGAEMRRAPFLHNTDPSNPARRPGRPANTRDSTSRLASLEDMRRVAHRFIDEGDSGASLAKAAARQQNTGNFQRRRGHHGRAFCMSITSRAGQQRAHAKAVCS
jgi:hypothetical protein